MTKRLRSLGAATAALAVFTIPMHAQVSPGRAALGRMQAAYAGKWYKSLTFIQKTTVYPPGAPERVSIWHESLRYTPATGLQLRIDNGDLDAGNGTLSTTDSIWVVRAGKLAQVRTPGNPFLVWIEGVYVQPMEETERVVKAMGVDLRKIRRGTWRNRPVTVIGAATPDDTTSSQAWIDDERQVIVRMIVVEPAATLDVFLDDYVRAGGGWLETKVDIYSGGVLRQREEYTDYKVDVPLPDALFDPAQWITAPHWGKKP